MKKQKILRILSLTMLAVLLTGALAGCGEQEPKEELTAGQIAEKLAALAEAQGLEARRIMRTSSMDRRISTRWRNLRF